MEFSRLLATVALVVVAGCLALAVPGSPVSDGLTGGETDPASGDAQRPADRLAADVPVSKNASFERLTRLLDVTGERPPVQVRRLDDDHRFEPSPFQRTMGLSGGADVGPNVAGLTTGGQVYVDPGNASDAVVEQVLVHEYVHAIQSQQGAAPWARVGDAAAAPTTDELTTRKALVEGGAIWATDRYVGAHLPDATRTSRLRSEAWRRGPAATAHVAGPYHFGHRYVAAHVDEVAELPDIYRTPPNTTEQILHNRSRSAAPPASLSLAVDPGPHAVVDEDVQGELATRVILRAGLDRETARDAAAGWGTDRRRTVQLATGGDDRGYVWAHRWDSASDATEFVAAVDEFVANRSDEDRDAIRLEQVSDETTVVFAGPPGFVDAAAASGSPEAVDVTLRPVD